jgi:(p)ppGpp synthase/HD superfamily hydrolase
MSLSGRFQEALVYAATLHDGQVRKGTEVPYVSHLLAVASLVLEHGGDEDEAIAGLLHDAVEDQGGARTLQEIRDRFGDRVAAIVEGCSDTDTIPKPPWRQRKERFLERVRTAQRSVLLVAAADKLHNARTLLASYRAEGEDVWHRFRGGRDGTLWYHRAVLDVLAAMLPCPLVDDLRAAVEALERAARPTGTQARAAARASPADRARSRPGPS